MKDACVIACSAFLAVAAVLQSGRADQPPSALAASLTADQHCDRDTSTLRRPATPYTTPSAHPNSQAAASHDGMVWIPAGEYWMGAQMPNMPDMEDAQPVHHVAVDGFWMDKTAVTNDQFAKFVEATGYVTEAERPLDPK